MCTTGAAVTRPKCFSASVCISYTPLFYAELGFSLQEMEEGQHNFLTPSSSFVARKETKLSYRLFVSDTVNTVN
jgi:hypothetical protein